MPRIVSKIGATLKGKNREQILSLKVAPMDKKLNTRVNVTLLYIFFLTRVGSEHILFKSINLNVNIVNKKYRIRTEGYMLI